VTTFSARSARGERPFEAHADRWIEEQRILGDSTPRTVGVAECFCSVGQKRRERKKETYSGGLFLCALMGPRWTSRIPWIQLGWCCEEKKNEWRSAQNTVPLSSTGLRKVLAGKMEKRTGVAKPLYNFRGPLAMRAKPIRSVKPGGVAERLSPKAAVHVTFQNLQPRPRIFGTRSVGY